MELVIGITLGLPALALVLLAMIRRRKPSRDELARQPNTRVSRFRHEELPPR